MYTVKPYYDADVTISVPSNMYRLQNVHQAEKGVSVKDCSTDDLDPVTALERRQEVILQRLEGLKNVLQGLKSRYKSPDTPSASVTSKAPSASKRAAGKPMDLGDGVLDLVVNADPDQVPFSLFVMFKLLQEKFRVRGVTHVHSSVTSKCATNLFPPSDGRCDYQIILTLIWKKVSNGPELMVNPLRQSVIQGEVNIVRYLRRLLDPSAETEDPVTLATCDELLDLVQSRLIDGNNKERDAALRTLNARLGRSSWLVGDSLSSADIAAWSGINQSKLSSDLPVNVKKWFKACDNNAMFQSARRVLL
ncbi:aminoacyl tRNA synthase complex-interacting multifunctional protein 2-like [Saccostrea echinata]|uniref:aminoacyl tRNA synthase complex-interacting multifunctional protein 2-like n=1 Tax=Saccostrea echinata TaxID=191078 RepID=UPI002A804940|nr:aminoacyl tRNA synthase complex-interacting multifunctional protein 2-like [Saccostrea echinata]